MSRARQKPDDEMTTEDAWRHLADEYDDDVVGDLADAVLQSMEDSNS